MSLKVILRQSVPNLGEPGDVKEVSPGYFRNFLQPHCHCWTSRYDGGEQLPIPLPPVIHVFQRLPDIHSGLPTRIAMQRSKISHIKKLIPGKNGWLSLGRCLPGLSPISPQR